MAHSARRQARDEVMYASPSRSVKKRCCTLLLVAWTPRNTVLYPAVCSLAGLVARDPRSLQVIEVCCVLGFGAVCLLLSVAGVGFQDVLFPTLPFDVPGMLLLHSGALSSHT